jgi:MOSC domain-containing protein YiiM
MATTELGGDRGQCLGQRTDGRRVATNVTGRVYQINISRGGVPKLPISQARIGSLGIEGDYQNDQRNHGGPDRAICLYTLEQIQRLQRNGHPISPGSTGENITLQGIELGELTPGTHLWLGDEVELEITSYAAPCKNISDSFSDGDFTRISVQLYPAESRVYARVLQKGTISIGQTARLCPVPAGDAVADT